MAASSSSDKEYIEIFNRIKRDMIEKIMPFAEDKENFKKAVEMATRPIQLLMMVKSLKSIQPENSTLVKMYSDLDSLPTDFKEKYFPVIVSAYFGQSNANQTPAPGITEESIQELYKNSFMELPGSYEARAAVYKLHFNPSSDEYSKYKKLSNIPESIQMPSHATFMGVLNAFRDYYIYKLNGLQVQGRSRERGEFLTGYNEAYFVVLDSLLDALPGLKRMMLDTERYDLSYNDLKRKSPEFQRNLGLPPIGGELAAAKIEGAKSVWRTLSCFTEKAAQEVNAGVAAAVGGYGPAAAAYLKGQQDAQNKFQQFIEDFDENVTLPGRQPTNLDALWYIRAALVFSNYMCAKKKDNQDLTKKNDFEGGGGGGSRNTRRRRIQRKRNRSSNRKNRTRRQ